MVAAVLAEFGRVDVLINNASIFSNLKKQPFDEIPPAEWQRVMEVNVNGVFFCASAVAKSMRERQFGRIINISSASVHRGTKNYLHYVTSKSALIGMTNSLAREVGPHGITVNCIRPGTVATEVAERVASLTHRDPSAQHRSTVHTADDRALGSCRSGDVPGHARCIIHHGPDDRL